jgi:4'-phosphopantetheinyl transferase
VKISLTGCGSAAKVRSNRQCGHAALRQPQRRAKTPSAGAHALAQAAFLLSHFAMMGKPWEHWRHGWGGEGGMEPKGRALPGAETRKLPCLQWSGILPIDMDMAALPLKRLRLPGSDDVKLWLAGPPQANAVPGYLWNVLSVTEKGRAERFACLEDRALFILTRGVLRCLISELTRVSAEEIQFAEGPSGKPHLSRLRGPHFNVSHSGGYALIGLSGSRPVGVDIERMRVSGDELNVARNYFSADEYRRLRSLKKEALRTAFYQIWTCKEAILKACGAGISGRAKTFTVELSKHGFALHPELHCALPALKEIYARPVPAPPGYAACCALA